MQYVFYWVLNAGPLLCFVLKVWAEPRVSCVPGSHSANEPHPQIVTFNIIYIVCIDVCGQRTACGASFRPPPHESRDQIQVLMASAFTY